MARRVLVLHGPLLSLDVVLGRKLSDLDAELMRRAKELGLEVESFHANSEAALVEALLERRDGLGGVIINPSSLAPVAFTLADAVEALGLRCIEVQLHHEAKARGRSALKRVVDRQLHGQGVEGYFKALAALAKDDDAPGKPAAEALEPAQDPATDRDDAEDAHEEADEPADPPGASVSGMGARGKTIGRKKSAAAATEAAPKGKSIGRRHPEAPAAGGKSIGRTEPRPAARLAPGALTRALVRDQLTARLGKKLEPEEFARWARTQWLALQHGAATEPGQKELLEDVLLMLSTSAKASDHVLLSYAAKLGA
ncbi:MAG: type II 3-dehydroquinate dehydratase [Myxococcaceae bacterium]|nr:type II 3-dehydroquinate dehydratase [Myxococcaceae bacterium]